MQTHTFIHICTITHTHTSVHVCIYTRTHADTRRVSRMRGAPPHQSYTYRFIHTCMHTHTHTRSYRAGILNARCSSAPTAKVVLLKRNFGATAFPTSWLAIKGSTTVLKCATYSSSCAWWRTWTTLGISGQW